MEPTCTSSLSVVMPAVATLGTAAIGVIGAVLLAKIQKKQQASSASIEQLHSSVERKSEETLREARELRRHLAELESEPSLEQQIRDISDALRDISPRPDRRIVDDAERFDEFRAQIGLRQRVEALHRRLDDLARDCAVSGRLRDRSRSHDSGR